MNGTHHNHIESQHRHQHHGTLSNQPRNTELDCGKSDNTSSGTTGTKTTGKASAQDDDPPPGGSSSSSSSNHKKHHNTPPQFIYAFFSYTLKQNRTEYKENTT